MYAFFGIVREVKGSERIMWYLRSITVYGEVAWTDETAKEEDSGLEYVELTNVSSYIYCRGEEVDCDREFVKRWRRIIVSKPVVSKSGGEQRDKEQYMYIYVFAERGARAMHDRTENEYRILGKARQCRRMGWKKESSESKPTVEIYLRVARRMIPARSNVPRAAAPPAIAMPIYPSRKRISYQMKKFQGRGGKSI